MRQKLISRGRRKRGRLPKGSIMPTTFSTNAWSPVSHSWMPRDKEERFFPRPFWGSCSLLPLTNTKRRTTAEFSVISLSEPQVRAKQLFPPGTGAVGCGGTAGGPRRGKGQASCRRSAPPIRGLFSLLKPRGSAQPKPQPGKRALPGGIRREVTQLGGFTPNFQGIIESQTHRMGP